jgi:hypothetical protein
LCRAPGQFDDLSVTVLAEVSRQFIGELAGEQGLLEILVVEQVSGAGLGRPQAVGLSVGIGFGFHGQSNPSFFSVLALNS